MINIKRVPAEVVWPVRHRVMYPGKNFDDIKLPQDASAVHLGLYEDDELVSVVSLFWENDTLQFRKFATLEKYQAKGYGSRLLNYVIGWARQRDIKRIWCNARKSAAPFYERFGLHETNTQYKQDGIEFVIMEMILHRLS